MSHAAFFSLATMTAALISNGSLGDEYGIRDKAVSQDGHSVALLFTNLIDEAINVVHGGDGKLQRTWMTPGVIQIGFAGEQMLVSFQRSRSVSTLARLNLQTGAYVNVGSYPGFDALDAGEAEDAEIVLVRRTTKDAWVSSAVARPGSPTTVKRPASAAGTMAICCLDAETNMATGTSGCGMLRASAV